MASVTMVSMEATPVNAPPEVTTKPEELREKVSSVALPMVMVLAATPVPIKTEPVVPESTVKLLAPAADLIVKAPLSAMLLAERVWVEALMMAPLIVLVAVGPMKFPPDVMVLEPVVAMVPEVEMAPSSLTVSLDTVPVLISMAVLVAPLESSRIKAAAVPCWVKVKDVSVVVSAKVKAMFLPSVVVIVLPEVVS